MQAGLLANLDPERAELGGTYPEERRHRILARRLAPACGIQRTGHVSPCGKEGAGQRLGDREARGGGEGVDVGGWAHFDCSWTLFRPAAPAAKAKVTRSAAGGRCISAKTLDS